MNAIGPDPMTAPGVSGGAADAADGGLVLQDISHAYDGVTVVRGVSLSVAPGEFVCLLGPSGCGKTTTLRIAAGLERPRRGRVLLEGVEVSGRGRHVPPEARHVGFLFQDYALFPHLSVADNVAFGIEGEAAAERSRRVARVLERVGMAAHAKAFPHMLSGGQQQRVALARALAPGPRLMLLDEPFSGLDVRLRDQVRDETLHVLKEAGVSTLMVTHDPEEAMFMADRIALMRDGRISQLGTPVDLYWHPVDAFAVRFFGAVNEFTVPVRHGSVDTALGRISAPGLAHGAAALVLIRPEAVALRPLRDGEEGACLVRVVASRLLGRSSLIHLVPAQPPLAVEGGDGEDPPLPRLHARIPGRFLPREGEVLAVDLDPHQTFIFAATEQDTPPETR